MNKIRVNLRVTEIDTLSDALVRLTRRTSPATKVAAELFPAQARIFERLQFQNKFPNAFLNRLVQFKKSLFCGHRFKRRSEESHCKEMFRHFVPQHAGGARHHSALATVSVIPTLNAVSAKNLVCKGMFRCRST